MKKIKAEHKEGGWWGGGNIRLGVREGLSEEETFMEKWMK